jgi:hypothetical protein
LNDFPIVAAEVKSLAAQAEAAATEMSHEIDSTNDPSGDIVGRLLRIWKSIKVVRA